MCGCNRGVVNVRAPPGGYPPGSMMDILHNIRTRSIVAHTNTWGPPLWWALHVLAEKSPNPLTPSLMTLWSQLMASFVSDLPCQECRQHFQTWYAANPVRNPIRLYILDLHNNVNLRRGVPVWNEAQLSPAYAGGTVQSSNPLIQALVSALS
jgi:hypothetical protein